jgi:hypothetical protein
MATPSGSQLVARRRRDQVAKRSRTLGSLTDEYLPPARTLPGGRARLLCRDAPRGEEREQRDPGEHDQRSAKTIEPCLLVDVEDRLGGFLAHACLVERCLEIGVRDEGHAAGELDVGLGLYRCRDGGVLFDPL